MFDAEKIWSSSTLPTLPAVAVKLLALSRDPETSISAIVEVIKTDPAICAKILQSTNSSFFGFSSQVTSIDRAVPLLGTTVVTSLALSFSLASDSVHSGPMQDHYRRYWKQSIIHAVAGEAIGKRACKGLDCEYFLAGLMIDIGRLAMLKTVSREYYPVIMAAESLGRPLHEVEQEFLGIDHSEVSYQLLKRWGLPDSFANGARLQHASEEVLLASLKPGVHTLEAAMALANAIGDYFLSPSCGVYLRRILLLSQYYFQLNEKEVETYLTSLRERVEQAGDLFSVDMSDVGDPSDLMAQANQQLLELTMRAHAESTQSAARQKQIEQEKMQLLSRNEELQEKVTRDALTGVYNRAYFDTALQQSVAHAQDRCQPIAIIFTDIDKFKQLNDTYGHRFGDEVLKNFARTIAKNLRSTDVLARYGGEEFVILVNRPTEKGVEKLAERIRSTVEMEPVTFQGTTVHITASFGSAIAIPGRQAHNCAENILQQADAASYDSKRGGRNRVSSRSLFTPEEIGLLKAINQAKFSRWLVNLSVLEIPAVSRALLQVFPDTRPMGQIANGLGVLSQEQIKSLLELQKQSPSKRFGELAVSSGLLSREEMTFLLSWQTEPPQQLRESLVSQGLLTSEECQNLFQQYLESSPLSQKNLVFQS